MARRGLGGKSLVLAAADEQFDVHREFVIDFLIDGPEPAQGLEAQHDDVG